MSGGDRGEGGSHADDAELLAEEEAGWATLHGLIDALTPEQAERPGYFEEGWTAKDVLAHVGVWLAEAGRMLERISVGTYRAEEVDVEGTNRRSLDAMRGIDFPTVKAQATAARTRMRHAWHEQPGPSAEASWWIRKAGPDHYEEHLPRLREWVEQLRSN